ncbi:MAG: hypothetical protein KDD19_13005 [Phaeodactylibacter sp.]|nr:hypothetical protein [Phaeodactylibacter sp.]
MLGELQPLGQESTKRLFYFILAANRWSEIGQGPGTAFFGRSYIPAILEAPGVGGRITGRQRAENLVVFMK